MIGLHLLFSFESQPVYSECGCLPQNFQIFPKIFLWQSWSCFVSDLNLKLEIPISFLSGIAIESALIPLIVSIKVNSLFSIAYTASDYTALFSLMLLASLNVITNCGVVGVVSAQISSFSHATNKLNEIIKQI